jgi:hypothetical protein
VTEASAWPPGGTSLFGLAAGEGETAGRVPPSSGSLAAGSS